MILFSDVHKSFGNKKVLNGLNLEVKKGEIFFILGGSGTGKSVALKSLIGLMPIDSGSIKYESHLIETLRESELTEIRKKISMVFQLPALLDSRTLLENLSLPIRNLDSKQKWDRIEAALTATKLGHLIPRLQITYPTSLSYGEQKRMSIARSLVSKPEVLLYDEPTTGMDSETAKQIHHLITDVSKTFNTTSIVVSHDINNALKTAQKIAFMNQGTSIFCGTPEDLKQSNMTLINEFLEASHIHKTTSSKGYV